MKNRTQTNLVIIRLITFRTQMPRIQKLNIKKSTQFDDILDYYKAPFHAKDNDQGEKLMFKCRWCAKVFKKSAGTKSNLIKNCDGNID
ncbi:hypothetical protein PTTG_30878 [Puccinia triticina 1-1 BBBD Race 1]|uniref:Uncharacterized protein n=1 Tax=Puccinia triticina (isolate 1-1 / race 1 (BBBD)) TaxID=630390 RepID=A0A180FZK2_PUCT1|nr:hypothetical protein PTTG_30878 [Puccinia triticina 1-1 BBBD Race 1]